MPGTETAYPVRLRSYSCQGVDANGESVTYFDLLDPGDVVGETVAGDEMNCRAPYGVVVKLGDDLWILPAGNEYPDDDHPLRKLAAGGPVDDDRTDGHGDR